MNTRKKVIGALAVSAFMFALGASMSSAATIATLSWTAPATNANGTPLTDLAGYKIYYGETSVTAGSCPASYPAGNTIDTHSTDTSYTFNNLTAGRTYFFQVTAYDTNGNQSTCSIDPGQASKLISFSSDFDNNHRVDIFDYSTFVGNFGKTGQNVADANRDGTVNIFDYSIFVGDFGKSF